jgi:DNA-binding XRE family transcriptional regulator
MQGKTDRKKFSDLVRALRQGMSMTQAQLAEAVGVEQATISRWEKGAEPNIESYRALISLAFDYSEAVRKIAEKFEASTEVIHRSWSGIENFVKRSNRVTDICGRVSIDGKVSFKPKFSASDLKSVPVPAWAPEGTIAVRADWDSGNLSFDRGWIYFYEDHKQPPSAAVMGHLCAAALDDGTVWVRRVYRGKSKSSYHLIADGYLPTLDARVVWASRVICIIP